MPKKSKQPAKMTRFKLVLICLAIAILFGEMFAYTWCKVQFRNRQYEIADLRIEGARLQQEQDNLRIELARLRSPERIATMGRELCGLTMPSVGQFVNLP